MVPVIPWNAMLTKRTLCLKWMAPYERKFAEMAENDWNHSLCDWVKRSETEYCKRKICLINDEETDTLVIISFDNDSGT